MRILLIIIWTTFFIPNTYSQGYHPLPETNATWLHTWHHWDWSHPDGEQIIFTDGDTTINSINYTKIEEKTIWPNMFTSADYLAAIRNDSINMKAYVVPKDSISEFLLYDFSLNVLDTIKNVFCLEYDGGVMSSNPPLVDYVIQSIDSFEIAGSYHKVVSVLNTSPGAMTVKWFEGYGSNHGLFGSRGFPTVSFWQEWNCMKNGLTSYAKVEDSVTLAGWECPITLSVPQLVKVSISLYPNPTSNELIVLSNNAHFLEILISSPNGEIVYRENSSFQKSEISTVFWKPGVYTVNIISENGAKYQKKITKL